MKHQPHSKPKFKVVRRPGKPIIKVALLGVLVLSTAALIAINATISSKEEQSVALEQQATALEQQNSKLEQYNANKDTGEGIKQVAQEELGLVDPDTVIYDFG